MRPYADHGYDELTDELAVQDPWEREYQRPSDFPSVARFLAATDRRASSPRDPAGYRCVDAGRSSTTGGGSSLLRPSPVVETLQDTEPHAGQGERLPSAARNGVS